MEPCASIKFTQESNTTLAGASDDDDDDDDDAAAAADDEDEDEDEDAAAAAVVERVEGLEGAELEVAALEDDALADGDETPELDDTGSVAMASS